MKDGLFTLVSEATEMLMDRPEIERELIYQICILDDEARAAIILAYRNIKGLYDDA